MIFAGNCLKRVVSASPRGDFDVFMAWSTQLAVIYLKNDSQPEFFDVFNWNKHSGAPKCIKMGRFRVSTGCFCADFGEWIGKALITIATTFVVICENSWWHQMISLFLALFTCSWHIFKDMSYRKDAFWGDAWFLSVCCVIFSQPS